MKYLLSVAALWLLYSGIAWGQSASFDDYLSCRNDGAIIEISGVTDPVDAAITVIDPNGQDITFQLRDLFRLYKNNQNGGFQIGLDGIAAPSLDAYTYTIVVGGTQSYELTFRRVAAEITGPSTVTLCDGAVQLQLSDFSPVDGVYSGTGVSPEGIFDPVAAGGPGSYVIDYSGSYEGCDYTTTFTVEVVGDPVGDYITGVNDGYCVDDNITGVVNPLGGVLKFNDNPVDYDDVTGEFVVDLSSFATGNYTLIYELSGGACYETMAIDVAGASSVQIYIGAPASACAGSADEVFFVTFIADGGDELPVNNGTFTNDFATPISLENGYFALNTAKEPGNYTTTFSFVYNYCTYTQDFTLTILPIESSPADLVGNFVYSCQANPLTLNSVPYDNSGFSLYDSENVLIANSLTETYITENNGIFSLDISILTNGEYRLDFDSGDGGCFASKYFQFVVGESPAFENIPSPIYVGCPATIAVSPEGGVLSYFAPDNPIPVVLSSNVFTAPTVGQYVLRYTTGCGNVDYIVDVQGVNPAIGGLLDAYYNNVTYVAMTGTPAGGTFTGNGVTGNVFNPQAAGVGFHVITYTVTVGECTYSTTQGVHVVQTLCANVPSGLNAVNITGNSATLSWNAATPAPTLYQVRYRKVGDAVEVQANVSGALNSLNVTGLEPGATYQFRVRALCNGVFTAFSPVYSFTTLSASTCEQPTQLTLSVTGGTVSVQWGAPYNDQIQYEVEVVFPDGINGLVQTTNQNQAVFSGLTEPGTYTVYVTALCESSVSGNILTGQFTIAETEPCLPVTELTAQVSGSVLTVGFALPATGSAPVSVRVAILGTGLEQTVTGSPAVFNISSLAGGQEYTVTAEVNCANASTSTSVSTSFTTPTVVECARPSISSIALTSNTATIRWGRIPGATSYVLQYRVEPGLDFINVNVPQTDNNVVAYTLSGLNASTLYAVRVIAVCGEGNESAPSVQRRFKTLSGNREGFELDFNEPISALTIYPNPSRGLSELSFVGAEDGPATLSVYDMRGLLVYHRTLSVVQGENQISLELNDKTAGLYLVKFAKGETTQTVRLVLE